mmetsp:Transcript_13896/g.32774  ORF Transcript_13896/g.32774 Transcript_13896/m.32774 type:complete len:247 (+) Transcript_13896:2-742(+)
MALFERYLNECNDMYVGEGAQSEYLLDICAQQNNACFENDAAGHVSCCCSYHPFTTFGESAPETTINGIAGFDPPARVSGASGGRRLSAGADRNQVLDICAQAWTDAKPHVERIYRSIQETGFPQVVLERNQLMQEKYGNDFCAFGSAGGNGDTVSDDDYDYYHHSAHDPSSTTRSSETTATTTTPMEAETTATSDDVVTPSFEQVSVSSSHVEGAISVWDGSPSIHGRSAILRLVPVALILLRQL